MADVLEQKFILVREKALQSRVLFRNEQVSELTRLLGFENLDFYLVGIDRLLGENAGYAFMEGEKEGILVQFHRTSPVDMYDLFVFSKKPFSYGGHYSTWLGEEILGGRLRKCDEAVNLGGEKMMPVVGALNAALCIEVGQEIERN